MLQLYDEDQARRFLAAAIAWPDETHDGVFNVVTKAPAKNGSKKPFYWNHIGVKNIDDAIKAIVHQSLKHGATDIYAWMSLGLPNAVAMHPGRPGTWYKGNRLAENAAWFKSIFIDLDFGGTKAYADLAAAQTALRDFLYQAKLPPPNLVVASGHGFHCHWTLTEAIPPDRWQDLSSRLVAAVTQHGLHCDTAVTTDRARILRVPGTWNNKDPKHPVKVTLIRERDAYFEPVLAAALAAYAPHAATLHVKHGVLPDGMAARPAVGPEESMGDGIAQQKIEIDIDSVVPECPLIADALITAGSWHANPLWHQMVYLSTFCKDGAEVAHELSSGHPTYDEDNVDRQYERSLQTRAARPELGWTKCQKLHDSGGEKICKGCPHLKEGKSPFNFTLEGNTFELPPDLIAVAADSGFLPERYSRNTKRQICITVASENPDEPPSHEPISNYPIYTGYLTENPYELHFSYLAEGNSGTVSEHRVRLPMEALGDAKQWRKHLLGQGFTVHRHEVNAWGDFSMAWVDTLRKAQESRYYDAAAFGWAEFDNKIAGFAYDGVTWGKTPRPAPTLKVLSNDYSPHGDLQPWKDATKLVTDRKRPELEILLASAFASPLVELLGDTAKGIQIFAWSHDSGVGKTTALHLAASVWGHPIRALQSTNDTPNSIEKRLSDLRNLPILWDEFRTAEQTDAFINFLFRASGGKGKSRLASDASHRTVGNWASVVACVSNAPMLERVYREAARTNAGALRIFEYEITKDTRNMIGVGEAGTKIGEIQRNYGRAGLVYAKWLGENFEWIIEDLQKFRDKLELKTQDAAQERFWSAAVTILVKGAQYARQLGLVDFDVRSILGFCMELLDSMRGDASTLANPLGNLDDVKALLSKYRGDLMQKQTVRFKKILTASGRPPPPEPLLYNAAALTVFSICESRDDNLLRFTVKSLEDWLHDRKAHGDVLGAYSANEITKAMVKHLGARILPQGRLAPGFDKDTGRQKIVEISTATNPDLKSDFT